MPFNPRRVTGIGIIAPSAPAKPAACEALRHSRSGSGRIESIDASMLNCRMAAKSGRLVRSGKVRSLHEPGARGGGRGGAAGWAHRDDPHRFGRDHRYGNGRGGDARLELRRIYAEGQTRLPPTSIAWTMYNAPASAVAGATAQKGIAYAVVSACLVERQCHRTGLRGDSQRRADVMLAGGADASLTVGCIRAWESMRVLAIDNRASGSGVPAFQRGSQRARAGGRLGVFVLESFEHAEGRRREAPRRDRRIRHHSDAGHVTDPSADGEMRAIRMALDGLSAATSATSTRHARRRAPTTSPRPRPQERFRPGRPSHPGQLDQLMHGHAMGASGAIEIACSLVALNEAFCRRQSIWRRPIGVRSRLRPERGAAGAGRAFPLQFVRFRRDERGGRRADAPWL